MFSLNFSHFNVTVSNTHIITVEKNLTEQNKTDRWGEQEQEGKDLLHN